MDFVSTGNNAVLLYVTVCEKVVPRLNKHDDVIEWNFRKIAPPEMKICIFLPMASSYNFYKVFPVRLQDILYFLQLLEWSVIMPLVILSHMASLEMHSLDTIIFLQPT